MAERSHGIPDRSARDDLQLVLFTTTVIICLMVGGTLDVLFNLRMRMMEAGPIAPLPYGSKRNLLTAAVASSLQVCDIG